MIVCGGSLAGVAGQESLRRWRIQAKTPSEPRLNDYTSCAKTEEQIIPSRGNSKSSVRMSLRCWGNSREAGIAGVEPEKGKWRETRSEGQAVSSHLGPAGPKEELQSFILLHGEPHEVTLCGFLSLLNLQHLQQCLAHRRLCIYWLKWRVLNTAVTAVIFSLGYINSPAPSFPYDISQSLPISNTLW